MFGTALTQFAVCLMEQDSSDQTDVLVDVNSQNILMVQVMLKGKH